MQDVVRFGLFDKTFENLARNLLRKPVAIGAPPPVQQPVQMKIEVKEDASAYTIRAEIPGLNKEDIKVSVEGNQVSIGTEVPGEGKETTGRNVFQGERHYRGLHSRVTLAHGIVQAEVRARYTEGVLEIVLPKSPAVRSRQITVR